VLIRGAEVEGRCCDLRIAGERIAELAGAGSLERRSGEQTFEAAGGALLPGLNDHHIHLLALAAADRSIRCGPPSVNDASELASALHAAPEQDGWVRGIGYHESVAGELDRAALDSFRADVPLRVQHRSGSCWSINSAGLARLGALPRRLEGVERDASGRPTGRLFGLDGWLRGRWGTPSPPDMTEVGARLAGWGVTGLTDATATNAAESLHQLQRAVRSGALPQRLRVMGTLDLPIPANARITRGPFKVVLSERDLPAPEELAERFRAAHADEREVAVHCTTRAELVLACIAFECAGTRTGDRIEHASIAPPDAVALLAKRGLTVVTQPNFVGERGDAYLREVDADDLPWLYRAAGLCEAGVALAGGTDAPFGDADPWRAMRAAVSRRTPRGATLGSAEALSPERALALFTTPLESPGGPPRRVEAGAEADLVLLDRPWADARDALSSGSVRATWCSGTLVSSGPRRTPSS
jgi:predicted amidohydrolase YtcJ